VENDESWNVPKVINYTLSFIKKDYKKSVIQPYYARISGVGTTNLSEEDSDLEVDFIEYLEKSKNVDGGLRMEKVIQHILPCPMLKMELKSLST